MKTLTERASTLPLRAVLRVCVVLLLVLALPCVAFGNAANPHLSGDPVGEPSGGLETVAIVRETLRLDLRPLQSGDPVEIVATYNLRSQQGPRNVGLVFVAPAMMEEGAVVFLDGEALPTEFQPSAAAAPPSWSPPKNTPGLGDEGDVGYDVRTNDTLAFRLPLPAGDHKLEVSYRARASSYSGDSPVRYWQVGYVLAPAREWAAFGGLDVVVQLPEDWRAAARPALTRSGGVLTGTFNGVPADNLAITVQAPPPKPSNLVPLGWALGFVLTATFSAFAGRQLGLRRRSSLWATPLSIALGVGWFILMATVFGLSDPARGVPDSQAAWNYGYRSGVGELAVSLLAFVVGMPLAQIIAYLARRRSRRPSTRTPDAQEPPST